MPDAAPQYRFTGRATGKDPQGFFHPRWDQAQRVSILAATRNEATRKTLAMLGTHPRFGTSGFGDDRDTPGWVLTWDQIDEETPSANKNFRAAVQAAHQEFRENPYWEEAPFEFADAIQTALQLPPE